MDVMSKVRERAAQKCPVIVFSEGNSPVIAEAAVKAAEIGIARCVLLGDGDVIAGHGIDTSGITVIDMAQAGDRIKEYAAAYEAREDFPAEAVEPLLADPLNFATMMVAEGDADALVVGYMCATADVVVSAQMFIGLAAGATTPSAYVILDPPDYDGGEDGLIVFADPVLVAQPSAEDLAGIALNTAESVRRLLGWEPRVGMLSFSTKGSASHPDVDKIRRATEIVKAGNPDFIIDGELQLDAAILAAVSEKKIKGENVLKGTANVLIFPDCDAGNIGVKLVQVFGKAKMYGAVMCGFARPVGELSRGASVEGVLGSVALTAAQV